MYAVIVTVVAVVEAVVIAERHAKVQKLTANLMGILAADKAKVEAVIKAKL